MKVWIVIAAWNEGKGIIPVVKGLRKAGYKSVIVVDDGSVDDTSKQAKKSGAVVLRHLLNRGQGAALRTGMQYALNHDADVIVHFDADGQHRLEDLPRILKPLLSGKADAALGSRFLTKKGKDSLPLARRVTLKIAVIVNWLLYGYKLTDAHNGFRALNRKACLAMNLHQDRMEHASEIPMELFKHKLRVVEVPVIILYAGVRQGHGSFLNALKMGFKLLLDAFTR